MTKNEITRIAHRGITGLNNERGLSCKVIVLIIIRQLFRDVIHQTEPSHQRQLHRPDLQILRQRSPLTDASLTHDSITHGHHRASPPFRAHRDAPTLGMSRYRPPRQAGSPYITPEGEQALRAELHALWKVERPEVTKAVSAAAANGDRSENGDYIYGKKRLREIDSRVRFLQNASMH